jgi:hypothetical protein
MKWLLLLVAFTTPAFAQQQPVPLTDWRAMLDADFAKLSMPRDAHAAIINLLQAYERQARAQAVHPPPPPKEGQ